MNMNCSIPVREAFRSASASRTIREGVMRMSILKGKPTQNNEQEALEWLLQYSPHVVLQSPVAHRLSYKSLPEQAEEVYQPQGGRNYQPAVMQFTCAPNPPTVIPATHLPTATNDPDAASRTALTNAGLNADQIRNIDITALRPIARAFGSEALTELLTRLRWAPDFIEQYGGRNEALVPRLLLHIPGHFRELARRAPNAREAHALESLGWLLMRSLRDNISTALNVDWWLPPDPVFVTPFANPLPPLSTEVRQIVLRTGLIDTTLSYADYDARFASWNNGLAGRHWQEETSGANPGLPFYANLAAIPATVNTAAQRQQFQGVWRQRLADTDRQFPPTPGQITVDALRNSAALRHCDNQNPHLPQRILQIAALQGLEMAADDFPIRVGAPRVTRLTVLGVLRPVFEAVFGTIRELGWNDLLYESAGAACFRGVKHPPHGVFQNSTQQTVNNITPQQRPAVLGAIQTARSMSNHGLGAAVDFNTLENWQGVATRPRGSMDPRIVALFEAYGFTWGACFGPTDPMHFEYRT